MIKTVEELTMDNLRLSKSLDKVKHQLQKQRDIWDEFYPLLVDRNKKIELELTLIKSKWWYKLFNWKWN